MAKVCSHGQTTAHTVILKIIVNYATMVVANALQHMVG